ncbi:MAG: DUF881 domain-containing protein [Clostridiaceae bacterium]|jgi:uncharacterized protein YlxW (UPF0749 family)|nr:DUF881 domain-containing protein [Clostridiaceae bacterium]
MNNKDKKYILMFIFILFGLLTTVQFRSIVNSSKNKPSIAYEIDKLKKELDLEIAEGNRLREEIDFNLKKKESILKTFSSGNDNGQLTDQWETAKLYAGLTDVIGEGVVLTLNDATEKNPFQSSLSLLHSEDIYEVVNELKKAGAQAISINNERVLPTTEVVCAGPTIRVNRNRYAVPFEIKAIGDPKRLYSTFNDSIIFASLSAFGIRVDIKEVKNIEIPKYNGNLDNLLKGLEVANP